MDFAERGDGGRVFKPGGGTKDDDPNIYVYTPEFAKRFQMPEVLHFKIFSFPNWRPGDSQATPTKYKPQPNNPRETQT